MKLTIELKLELDVLTTSAQHPHKISEVTEIDEIFIIKFLLIKSKYYHPN